MQYYVVGDEKFSSIDSSGWSETYVDMRQIDRRKLNLISFIREPPPSPNMRGSKSERHNPVSVSS